MLVLAHTGTCWAERSKILQVTVVFDEKIQDLTVLTDIRTLVRTVSLKEDRTVSTYCLTVRPYMFNSTYRLSECDVESR